MYKSQSPPRVRLLLAVLALLAFGATSLWADKVIVTSRDTGGTKTAYPPYNDTFTGSDWFNSSGKCTPVDDNPNTPSRFLCLSGTSTGTIIVKPGLANAGHTYKVDLVGPITSSTTADTCVEIAITGGTGTLDTNKTLCFGLNGINGTCKWTNVCYITNASTDVEITFTYSAYLIDGVTTQPPATATRRFFSGAYRFTDLSDICGGVAAPGQVYGGLSAGQTSVQVPGISASATAVTVYADGVQIGTTTTVASPVTTVPVTALIQGQKIVATQTIGGIASCPPTAATAGPIVGGGANPPDGFKVNAIFKQVAGLTGPIGTSVAGILSADPYQYHKPATGTVGSGYVAAPVGGISITPSACWQTITINPGDSAVTFTTGAVLPDVNQYAVFTGLAFAYPDSGVDTGPYQIYIDRIYNGDTLVEGFEGVANGTTAVLFGLPSAAGILGNDSINAPNTSVATNTYATGGAQSCLFSFQYNAAVPSANIWQRAVASGTTHPYPQLDITKPITIDLLLLPVGQTAHNFGSLSEITNASPAYTGQPKTLGVSVTGTGPFTYQWTWSGGALANTTTDRTYSIPSLSSADDGTYTVAVSDGTCTEARSAIVTVSTKPPPTAAQIDSIVPGTGTYTINYSGGVGDQFVLVTSPTVTTAMSGWSRVKTNSTGTGSFTVAAGSGGFYRVSSENNP